MITRCDSWTHIGERHLAQGTSNGLYFFFLTFQQHSVQVKQQNPESSLLILALYHFPLTQLKETALAQALGRGVCCRTAELAAIETCSVTYTTKSFLCLPA